MTDRVAAWLGQADILLFHFPLEEPVRNLNENAGAIAHQRIGADGAAMGQVFEHEQAVLDRLMGRLVGKIGNEANAACITLVRRMIQALGTRQATNRRQRGRRQREDSAGALGSSLCRYFPQRTCFHALHHPCLLPDLPASHMALHPNAWRAP